MLFVFGPSDTYFFDDGNGNRKWRAGPEFNTDIAEIQRKRGTIDAAALGAGRAHFMGYTYTTANGSQYGYMWEDPQHHYPALHSWLFAEGLPHKAESVYVSLGARGSFFAVSDQGHRWRNIPEALQEYYQKFTRPDLFRSSRVNTVDLGGEETFLGLSVNGQWFWNLGHEYPELSRMIGQKGINDCQYLMINPFAPNQHVAKFGNQMLHWSLPPLLLQDIQDLVRQYANQAGAHLPPNPALAYTPPATNPLPLASRPVLPSSPSSSSSGRWRPPWGKGSGNASSPAHSPPPMSPPVPRPAQSPVVSTPGASGFDWNQAMSLTQSTVDAYNNVQAQGGNAGVNTVNNVNSGLQLVNNLASNGLMIGQLGGQFVGAAAACCMM